MGMNLNRKNAITYISLFLMWLVGLFIQLLLPQISGYFDISQSAISYVSIVLVLPFIAVVFFWAFWHFLDFIDVHPILGWMIVYLLIAAFGFFAFFVL